MSENTALKTTNPETSIAAVIERAARDVTIDVSKMERLLEFGIRIQEREAAQSFNIDFSLAIAKMPHVTKRGVISMGGKGSIPFARYEDLDRAIRPVEIEFGFSRSFLRDGTNMVLVLAHKNGHSVRSIRPIIPDSGPGRDGARAEGSGASYAKRYLTKDIWNIITDGEDDDGRATGAINGEQASKIEALIEESGADKVRFLKHFGINSIPEMQHSDFPEAEAMLNQKKRGKKNEAPAS